jgi:S-adenosylmethionine hydrolase
MRASGTPPTISLLTDFGTRDHYVATMKGVIAQVCPEARVIDISHEIEPYQIAQGAYLLGQAWRWFPKGTVHIAVIDPGVGSARRALAAAADGHLFVLPDNGLLALLELPQAEVHSIENESLFLRPVSNTFHGRDIFAPAAAHLACGLPLERIGPRIDDWHRAPPFESPQILHIDRFGNVVTNLRAAPGGIRIGDITVNRRATHYAEAPAGELFLIEGSAGYIEVSLRASSAAAQLNARVGQSVSVLDGR